ncbi:glycosyltransferase family 2 protein [Alsobacter sp. SYSU BS001988]
MAESPCEPKISIIIVTFRSAKLIERCLLPLMALDEKIAEIIVWDNQNEPELQDIIRAQFPRVRLYVSDENLGFARANNRCMELCGGSYIFLLNPDAFLRDANDIQPLIEMLESDVNVGAVSPKLINEDGSHQVGDCGWRFTVMNSAAHLLGIHRFFGSVKSIYLSSPPLLALHHIDVDWLCAACLLVRKVVVEQVGGLDERFFMYGEDVEWGERMRMRGYTLRYCPNVEVLHLQGGTQKTGGRFFSDKWIESLLVVIGERQGTLAAFVVSIIGFIGFSLRALLSGLRQISVKNERRVRYPYWYYAMAFLKRAVAIGPSKTLGGRKNEAS